MIVGAGVFGASLAWLLARDGVAVTLVDRFEPGDPRATSGGESRLIRCGHGPDGDVHGLRAPRTGALARARGGVRRGGCMVECGLVWMAHARGRVRGRERHDHGGAGDPLRAARARHRRATTSPSFGAGGLAFLFHEPEAGVLRAQRATQALARRAAAHGAAVVRAGGDPRRRPGRGSTTGARSRRTSGLGLRRWLGGLFPAEVEIRSTRQELFFFAAVRRGRRPACPPTSTSTTRSTARATSTGSA